MFEFSIAIPAHDRGENGPKWMSELLDSLERQTFQDFEVVVSDQSKNDDIMNVCKDYDFQFTFSQSFFFSADRFISIAKTAPSARDVAVSASTAASRSATALPVPAVPATTRQRSARPVRRHVRGADREGAGAALC